MAVTEKEYVIFCDESLCNGAYFSNFYGGVIVGASQFEAVSNRLNAVKTAQNLHGEVKWTKVTKTYLPKYIELMDAFFDELKAGNAKVRIMFRQNARRPADQMILSAKDGFYKLYYQFVKHAFGFAYMPSHAKPVRLRLYFDQFPDTGEQVAAFRGFLLGLNRSKAFQDADLTVAAQDVAEVVSHDHVLLQCVDVVLGSMAFRLNDLHKQKPAGAKRRGSRTIAKEKLYNHIRNRIRELRPMFNVGISTGGTGPERWEQPYRHWAFRPEGFVFDKTLTKK
ncbi:MAG: DUF3800 domain-containing protein [Phycisphaerales bacterium]|nr:DUF3800 domain-containing protein [Phycisphaerales bacterium]